MSKPPIVALFNPDERERQPIQALFTRQKYSIQTLEEVDDLLERMDQGDHFDVAVVPTQLRHGSSGVAACISLKSHELLASIPVIAISQSSDKPPIQMLYESGADLVIQPNHDPDLLYFQIGALKRMARSFEDLSSNRERPSTKSTYSTDDILDLIRDGVLIVDEKGSVLQMNKAARSLLAIGDNPSADETKELVASVRIFIDHYHQIDLAKRFKGAPEQPKTKAPSLGVFTGNISLTALSGSPTRSAIYLVDTTEAGRLGATLAQAHRLRSLCLLSAATCRQILDAKQSGQLGSPIASMEKLLSTVSPGAALDPVVRYLLELLDPVLSTTVNLKVAVSDKREINLPAPDLMQLTGHLILEGIDFAGEAGEVVVSTGPVAEGVLTVLLSAHRLKEPAHGTRSLVSDLLDGDFSTLTRSVADSIPAGLKAAQAIAGKYRTEVEFQLPTKGSIKMRVQLPVKR
jgi:CheY-like chemotaxis protein